MELWFFESFFIFRYFSRFPKKRGIELVEVYLNFEMSKVVIVHPGSIVFLSFQLRTLWEALSVSPSIGLLVRLFVQQPDKKQSQEIPKPHTYDFLPTARAAFIGKERPFPLQSTFCVHV